MSTDPIYPIGRLAIPRAFVPNDVARAVEQIEALPNALRSALDGCAAIDEAIRPGAWSIRALVHHLADSHLNAFVRTKLALTEIAPVVRPYDEVAWARTPDAAMPVEPSLALLDALHRRWVHLLRALEPADFARMWRHPDAAGPQPLWHLPITYAWHGDHHVAQIVAARVRVEGSGAVGAGGAGGGVGGGGRI